MGKGELKARIATLETELAATKRHLRLTLDREDRMLDALCQWNGIATPTETANRIAEDGLREVKHG